MPPLDNETAAPNDTATGEALGMGAVIEDTGNGPESLGEDSANNGADGQAETAEGTTEEMASDVAEVDQVPTDPEQEVNYVQEGRNAYLGGTDLDGNPHSGDTEAHEQWKTGWTEEHIVDINNHGYNAFFDSKDRDENPHAEGTAEHSAWDNGWVRADEEANG